MFVPHGLRIVAKSLLHLQKNSFKTRIEKVFPFFLNLKMRFLKILIRRLLMTHESELGDTLTPNQHLIEDTE